MLNEENLKLAKKLGAKAAADNLTQEQMAVAILHFRDDWAGVMLAERIEEFLIAIAEEYYRRRKPETVN
jgi:hypothetical protein